MYGRSEENSVTEVSNGLKILGCITELDVGGAEKAFVRILTGLKSKGWSVRAVSLRDAGPLSDDLRQAGISVDALQCGGIADFRAFWRLKRLVQSSSPDVVLSFLHQANFYARLTARRYGSSAVVSGIRVADRRKSITWPDRWTSGRVDQYVGVSREVMRQHSEWCGLKDGQCCWIPNGVDLPVAIDEAKRVTDRLLFVGRLTQQKSPQTLLNALSVVRRQGMLLTLQIVGSGPLQAELEQQVRDLGLSHAVEFLGHRSDVPEIMQQATALVLPSQWEGMPNVVLEAMANGLPVIASDIHGIRDVVVNGKTGVLVPTGDSTLMADAIANVVGNADLRSSLASAAAMEVAKKYDWESVVSSYDDLLRAVVAKRNA